MDVVEVLDRLCRAQEIDREIMTLTRTRNALPVRLEDSKRALDGAQQAFESRRNEAMRERALFDEIDTELKSTEQRIKVLRELRDLTSERALQAQQREMAELRSQSIMREEEGMRHMIAYEKAEAELPALREAHEKAAAEYAEQEAALAGEIAEYDKQIKELETKRTQAVEGVADVIVREYERLFQSNNGRALARIDEDGVCDGCYAEVTLEHKNRVTSRAEIVNCPSCHRILCPS